MAPYRSTDKTPLCCSCGGASLTPLTKFDNSEGYPNVYFRSTKPERTLFSSEGKRAFAVDRARVCLDCGHVMLRFSEGRLAELRAELASLEPSLD